jgi:XTP/dITP diphosphohydrolase
MELVFATSNPHKVKEVQALLPATIRLLSLRDIGCADDIPETAATLEGNALLKARYVRDKYGRDCIADDSGLEVEALGGAPGVHSARYAGTLLASDNIARLLRELGGVSGRKARFRTVLACLLGGEERIFEGTVHGTIAAQPAGTMGFGYDPVFLPEGSSRTFAEMLPEEKNAISHRAEAVSRLAVYLSAFTTHPIS